MHILIDGSFAWIGPDSGNTELIGQIDLQLPSGLDERMLLC